MKYLTCIECPIGCSLSVEKMGVQWEVKGNRCTKGRDFAINEMTDPRRSICSTVRTTFQKLPRLPVRTSGDVSLNIIFDVMDQINAQTVHNPIHMGEVIIENVCNTGVNIIAALDLCDLLGED